MEDRFRRLSRLGLPMLGTATIVLVLVFRADAKAALRMAGLWTYLVTVNRTWPGTKLVLDAQRASSEVDVLVPYWGSQR